MKWRHPVLLVVGLFLAFIVFQATSPVRAAGTVGTGTPDSCTEAAFEAALLGGGNVTFNCGKAPITILFRTEKSIAQNTVIDGDKLITLSGGNRVRIFRVNPGITLEIRKLTLAHGAANDTNETARDGVGGAVLNDSGTLILTDSTITSGRADHSGGAIYNRNGTITLVRAVVFGNFVGDNGGAILNEKGAVTIANSTLSSNFAGKNGGGVFNFAGAVTITNGTLYNNSAGFNGSGILNNQEGTFAIKNTIIANTPSGDTPLSGNCGGDIIDGNKNLQFPDDTCGKTIRIADPLFGTLSDNGGLVLTHALKAGSPAIDQGDASVCQSDPINSVDARSIPRTVGRGCDIGAYEYDPKNPGKGFDAFEMCVTPTPTRRVGNPPRRVTPTQPAGNPQLPCNNNGFCDAGESYYTCPKDCPFAPIPAPGEQPPIAPTCVPYGGFCSSSAQCCDGTPCTGGRCRYP